MDTADDAVPKTRKIRGWLLVFLLIVLYHSAAVVFAGASEAWPVFWSWLYSPAEQVISILACVAYYWALAGFGVYTVLSFTALKPTAVSVGKIYLLAVFVSDLIWAAAEAWVIALTTSDFSQLSYSLKDVSRSLMFFAIWYAYLSSSQRVQELFPRAERVTSGRDIALLLGFLATTAIIAVFSFLSIGGDSSEPSTDDTRDDAVYYDAVTLASPLRADAV